MLEARAAEVEMALRVRWATPALGRSGASGWLGPDRVAVVWQVPGAVGWQVQVRRFTPTVGIIWGVQHGPSEYTTLQDAKAVAIKQLIQEGWGDA